MNNTNLTNIEEETTDSSSIITDILNTNIKEETSSITRDILNNFGIRTEDFKNLEEHLWFLDLTIYSSIILSIILLILLTYFYIECGYGKKLAQIEIYKKNQEHKQKTSDRNVN